MEEERRRTRGWAADWKGGQPVCWRERVGHNLRILVAAHFGVGTGLLPPAAAPALRRCAMSEGCGEVLLTATRPINTRTGFMLFAPFPSSAHHGPCGERSAASGDGGDGGGNNALRKDDKAAVGSCLTVDATTMASSSGIAEAPVGAHGDLTWAKMVPPYPAAVEALAMKAVLASAVRMEPRGLLPGSTGARVGLLHGLRTADMDKYDEVRSMLGEWVALCVRNEAYV